MTPELSPEQTPLSLAPDLLEALRRIAATEHLLVAMDFDGTMAPLVDHAGDARALPRSAAAFAALTELPRTTTALISGRALDSLRAVAFPPEKTLLIGSHGAEVWMGPGSSRLELDDARRELLAEVRRELEGIVEVAPGTLLEDKPAGVVLHTRLAADDVAEDAVAAARAVLQDRPGVYLKSGNRVLETSVVHASKGEGVAFLRQASRRHGHGLRRRRHHRRGRPGTPAPRGSRGEGRAGLHPGPVPDRSAGACFRAAGGPAAGTQTRPRAAGPTS